eukprot:12561681-Prorocentrum_lima.AAC.1
MDPSAEAAHAPATYRGVPNACKQEYADFTEELCRALTRAHARADERMEVRMWRLMWIKDLWLFAATTWAPGQTP